MGRRRFMVIKYHLPSNIWLYFITEQYLLLKTKNMNGQTLSNIRSIRRSLDFKQKSMAHMLGISQTYYSNMEAGKKNMPDEIKKGLEGIFKLGWEKIENYHKKEKAEETSQRLKGEGIHETG